MKRLIILFSAFLVVMFSVAAHATVITFEDILPANHLKPVPSGYAGFTWGASDYVMDPVTYGVPSGYVRGTMGALSIFGAWEQDISMARAQPFDFLGAYITAAWNDNEKVTVEGWLNGARKYSRDIFTSADHAYWWDFNFNNIDQLVIRSLPEDGTWAGEDGAGSHQVVDNITYNGSAPVPEPATMLLVGGGLSALIFGKRRRGSLLK
ncbi:MAG: PEP-CTERM sorting domain-containing protein [Pseudomonadota bacterium]